MVKLMSHEAQVRSNLSITSMMGKNHAYTLPKKMKVLSCHYSVCTVYSTTEYSPRRTWGVSGLFWQSFWLQPQKISQAAPQSVSRHSLIRMNATIQIILLCTVDSIYDTKWIDTGISKLCLRGFWMMFAKVNILVSS